jgi:hypothetical protein
MLGQIPDNLKTIAGQCEDDRTIPGQYAEDFWTTRQLPDNVLTIS